MAIPHLLLGLFENLIQFLDITGLLEELECLQPSGGFGRVQAAVPGEHDGLNGRIEGPYLLQSLEAVHIRHLQVENGDVDVLFGPDALDCIHPVVNINHIPSPGS